MLTGFAYARPQLEEALLRAVRGMGVEEVPDLELQRARNPRNGDYASPVAMKLARALHEAPPQIAARLAQRIGELPEAEIEVAGPYLNFRLRAEWLHRLATVAALDERYGSSELGGGERVQVEFGSINPTGPLHVGHGRGVVLGDSLSRILEFTGHQVQREYYVNDQNTQARLFGESVYARLTGSPLPEKGYAGDYVTALAEEARAALPGIAAAAEAEAQAVARVQAFAIERMVEQLRASLLRMRVDYDEWYFESTLWRDGLAQEAIELLRGHRMLSEHDGAVWFSLLWKAGNPTTRTAWSSGATASRPTSPPTSATCSASSGCGGSSARSRFGGPTITATCPGCGRRWRRSASTRRRSR